MTITASFPHITPSVSGAALRKVMILQPDIHHYRTAIFDGLIERGASGGTYTIEVLGGMKDGKAIGGSTRPYFREVPRVEFRRLGMILYQWPAAPDIIAREKPAALIMEANIRNMTCWRLLKDCKAMGIPVIGWSKIHSYSHTGAVMTLLKKRFYSRFDRMICYGESSWEELVGMGYPADRAIIANNTIDTRKIFTEGDQLRARGMEIRRERGLADKKILLCIGRMDPDKRHQDLLSAWPRLRELDPTLTLVLISGGPLLEDIRAKAAALDPDRIVVTGRVAEGDDYAWIATSDACIYPGAVGLAINQSLAFGRPTLIANELGADSEILVGAERAAEQTGWRYERGNLDAMVAGVDAILRGGPEVASVCERATALMRDKVTLDNMIGAIDRSIRLGLALRKD